MPAKPTRRDRSETVQLLRGIWNEIKVLNQRIDRTREELSARIDETNQRLDLTNRRLDETNQRLDETNQRLDRVEQAVEQLRRVQIEVETRIGSELVALARAVANTHELVKNRLDVRDRLDDHEQRIAAIERRFG